MTDTPEYVFFTGELEDGTHIAYRDREPLFCFYCETEQEAVSLAQSTLNEHQARFRHREITTRVKELSELAVHTYQKHKQYALEEEVA